MAMFIFCRKALSTHRDLVSRQQFANVFPPMFRVFFFSSPFDFLVVCLVLSVQACYSLGNTYTLLRDYEHAVDFHTKHLVIAQELGDRSVCSCDVIENGSENL